MAIRFKVWASIEVIDEDRGCYADVATNILMTDEVDSLDEAIALIRSMLLSTGKSSTSDRLEVDVRWEAESKMRAFMRGAPRKEGE